ncbi:MAG: hypothetical protein R2759_16025 [Bacteroidales bacterium]
MVRFWFVIACMVFSIAGIAQNASKSAYFYKDYIIHGKDTIVCKIDENSLDKAKISYTLPGQPEKPKSIKSGDVSELKCRFVYKNLEVNGKKQLLKVMTEDVVSLYSTEKKGKTQISDEKKPTLATAEKAPSRSTFYINKDGNTIQLNNSNYKSVLKQTFVGNEALQTRVDEMDFEDLEFTLLNMVIRYNYGLANPEK